MRMMNTQKGANRRKPQARSCAQPPAPGSAIERSTAGTKPLRELFGGGFQCPPPPAERSSQGEHGWEPTETASPGTAPHTRGHRSLRQCRSGSLRPFLLLASRFL